MDDQQFDDLIKKKAEGYQETGFEPTALAALHHQLAAKTGIPWYAYYRYEIFTATAIAIGTSVLVFVLWLFYERMTSQNQHLHLLVTTYQEEMARLKNDINAQKSMPPDTVKEATTDNDLLTTDLINQIFLLRQEIQQLKYLQKENSIHRTAWTTNQDNDGSDELLSSPIMQSGPRINPQLKQDESKRAVPMVRPSSKYQPQQPPASTLREIEKNYMRGVGIRIGPTGEVAIGNYQYGAGDINYSAGMLGDFIVSPSLSLEAGFKLGNRYYEINRPEELSNATLPDASQPVGELKRAEIDSRVLEFPVQLKYRYPLALKSHALFGFGYTPIIYRKQFFEYSYQPPGMDKYLINSTYNINKTAFYPGSLRLTIGLAVELKNKKILESSLFYQKGLGTMGEESINANFLGMRGVYWFKIR